MPKITILGSCSFQPYEILAVPEKNEMWNTEEGYQLAFKKFKKAIDDCDFVFVYNPYGIGEHTGRDLEYAKSQGKHIVYFESWLKEFMSQNKTDKIRSSEQKVNE